MFEANNGAARRSAPQFLRVRFPPGRPTRPAVILVIIGLLAAAGTAHLMSGTAGGRWDSMASVAAVYLVGAAFALGVFIRSNRAYRPGWEALHADLDALQDVEVAQELRRLFGNPYLWPATTPMLRALARATAWRPTAVTICFGEYSIPRPADYRFEPEVLSPTQRTGREFLILPWAAGFTLATWIAASFLPTSLRFIAVFTGACAFAAILRSACLLVEWGGRVLFAPDYIRIAPGIIQVLRYRPFRRAPIVESFPMESGTLVVAEGRRCLTRLTLLRHGKCVAVPLRNLLDVGRAHERIWYALMSTAPTPPLSPVELVG